MPFIVVLVDMQGRKQHQEKLFVSFQLSQRVPADNFYRRLKDSLDLRWLYKKTAKYYGSEGQKSIDPVVFMKLMLIGYLENLGSDRRIIATAQMRLDMLYFLGYDLDEQLPWHSTLSRTRQLYGEEVFRELFVKVLRKAIEKGMVAGKRQAIDSAPVKANASMNSLKKKEILQDGAEYAEQIKEEDDEDRGNPGNDDKVINTVSAAKQKSVEQHHAWKEKAYKDMPGGSKKKTGDGAGEDEKYMPKFVSNHTHYSTTDADARVSVKPGKARQLNYHAHLSVDTAHHVITCVEAHHADKKDSQCLPSLLNTLTTNLKTEGLIVEEVLADAGYSSGEALKALERKNITGYIPNFGQYKPFREGFTYHAEGDYYECSRGAKLVFKKIKDSHEGAYRMRHYRSSSHDCKACPLKATCIGKSNEKKIEDTVDKPYYDRMHLRLQTPKAKRLKKVRSSTVEPVLGTLTSFLAMKRVNTRGMKGANKCMLMAAVAYNLKKLLKWQPTKVQADVKAMAIKAEKVFLNSISALKQSIAYYTANFYPSKVLVCDTL